MGAVRFWLVVGEDPNNPLSAAEEIQNLSHLIHSSRFEEESQTPTRPTCVSASQSTSVRPAARLAMPVGSCTAWSMASSPTGTCLRTSSWAVMTPLPPSSRRLVPGSMSRGQSSLIWNQLSLMRYALAPTANSSILSNCSLARRMLPTITREAITRLERKLLTWSWIESESSQTNAPDFRASFSSTPLVEALDLASPPFSWRDSLWTMGKNPSWSSPSTLPLKWPQLWLNPTMQS